jgi:hypothetical protein
LDDFAGRNFDSAALEEPFAFKFKKFHGDSRLVARVEAGCPAVGCLLAHTRFSTKTRDLPDRVVASNHPTKLKS